MASSQWEPAGEQPAEPQTPPERQSPPEHDAAPTKDSKDRLPFTRAGAAWVSLGAAAVIAILLVTFLAQNTQSVEMSFLWMSTSTSLAVMLLIAALSGVVITLILGTARIVQLRRTIRKDRGR